MYDLLVKNINKYRINSILIILITLALTYLSYVNTYSLSAETNELSDAISEYIFNEDVNAQIELIHKENNWIYVLFSDRRYGNEFKGLARLKCGWNGKHTIFGANYGSGYPVTTYFFAQGDGVFSVYGLFPDERAVCYEYADTGHSYMNPAVYSGTVSERAFIQICRDGEPDWMGLHVYDSMGEDITDSYNGTRNVNAPEGTTSTAELFMVNLSCGFILFLGFLLAFLCWRNYKLS